MSVTVEGNTVTYTTNKGVVRKIVIMSSQHCAEKYARGSRDVKPISVLSKKNGNLKDE